MFANIVDVASKDSEPRYLHSPRRPIRAGVSKHPCGLSHRVSDITRNNVGFARRHLRGELAVEFAVEGIERVYEVGCRRFDLGRAASIACRTDRERRLIGWLIRPCVPPDALSR
jgi:hypothetical protein